MFHHTGLKYMTTSRPVNSQDLMFKLSEVLFSTEVEPFIQVLNKTEANASFEIGVSLEDFRKMTDEEQNDLLEKVAERTRIKSNMGKLNSCWMVNIMNCVIIPKKIAFSFTL